MSDKPNPPSRPTPLGIYDKPRQGGVTSIEVVALILSALWLLGAAAFFLLSDTGAETTGAEGLRFLITMLSVFMPVAMIWVAATAARSSRVMREESARLQAAIDGIRQSYVAQQQRGGRGGPDASVARKLDEIAEAAKKTETALATFHTRRDRSLPVVAPKRTAESEEDQGLLALGTPAEELSPPLPTEDFIRALHFPETAEDEEGFTALRRALRDRRTAQIVQASQDVLTLLSQDGI